MRKAHFIFCTEFLVHLKKAEASAHGSKLQIYDFFASQEKFAFQLFSYSIGHSFPSLTSVARPFHPFSGQIHLTCENAFAGEQFGSGIKFQK
jgi:hypothetical protein